MRFFKIFILILTSLVFITNFANSKTILGKAKIIDGDTIHIKSNKIRLHGIDAPETKQTCKIDNQDWYCGKQSTKELKNLIKNQKVECNVNDVDRYNRYVAICYVNEININQWMVKNGWAIAYRYYSEDYVLEEKYANDKKLGIWKSEFIEPYAYRKKQK
jgi:endonuclease YncB( thermonuclease family)